MRKIAQQNAHLRKLAHRKIWSRLRRSPVGCRDSCAAKRAFAQSCAPENRRNSALARRAAPFLRSSFIYLLPSALRCSWRRRIMALCSQGFFTPAFDCGIDSLAAWRIRRFSWLPRVGLACLPEPVFGRYRRRWRWRWHAFWGPVAPVRCSAARRRIACRLPGLWRPRRASAPPRSLSVSGASTSLRQTVTPCQIVLGPSTISRERFHSLNRKLGSVAGGIGRTWPDGSSGCPFSAPWPARAARAMPLEMDLNSSTRGKPRAC